MRDLINLFENDIPGDLYGEICSILQKHLDDASYSGVDQSEYDAAAYDIAVSRDILTREMVKKFVDSISTYDPWEGFELHAIDNAVNEICQKMGVE